MTQPKKDPLFEIHDNETQRVYQVWGNGQMTIKGLGDIREVHIINNVPRLVHAALTHIDKKGIGQAARDAVQRLLDGPV